MRRRHFLFLLSQCFAAISFLGCKVGESKSGKKPRTLSLGALSSFTFGVTVLPLQRVAVIKDEQGIAVMQAVCTHMTCGLEADRAALRCPCHGSRFSLDGSVQNGPARKPLKFFAAHAEVGELIVNLAEEVSAATRLIAH